MGESFRFIHCSDLHLGCDFVGISKNDAELGRKLRDSVFSALDRIVSVAKKEKVDFVIISGDVFDSQNETPYTRVRFCDAISSLKVPCFIAYGNHDVRRKWEATIPLPKNAFVFPVGTVHRFVEKNGVRLAEIIGSSFDPQAPDYDHTSGVRKDSDCFGIGVFHCNVDGAKEGDLYAPCKLKNLVNSNLDYWALGHIHKRAILSEDPYVVYPGNTQGMSSKEEGEKGGYVVTVTDGVVTDMKFFRTGAIQWRSVSCDITGYDDLKKALSSMTDKIEKGSMLSVTFTGRGALDPMLRLEKGSISDLIEASTGCTMVSMKVETAPDIDLEKRSETGDFISAVLNFGKRIEQYDRKDIMDLICSTQTAENLRDRFEEFTDEELKDIVRDSMYLIVDKMEEAER